MKFMHRIIQTLVICSNSISKLGVCIHATIVSSTIALTHATQYAELSSNQPSQQTINQRRSSALDLWELIEARSRLLEMLVQVRNVTRIGKDSFRRPVNLHAETTFQVLKHHAIALNRTKDSRQKKEKSITVRMRIAFTGLNTAALSSV